MEPIIRAAFIVAGAIVLLAAATIFAGGLTRAMSGTEIGFNSAIVVAIFGLGIFAYGFMGKPPA